MPPPGRHDKIALGGPPARPYEDCKNGKMLPEQLQSTITHELSVFLGKPTEILSTRSVGGGCIHNACLLATQHGDFFLKYNAVHEAANFRAERRGLQLLLATGEITIPEVIAQGSTGAYSFLLMHFIASSGKKVGFWTSFGRQLAALHKHKEAAYGLDHDNFIGRLPQHNDARDDWHSFFAEMRLQPQLKLAMEGGLAGNTLRKQFEALFPRLRQLMPAEPPSLLHGDLWSGNFMVGPQGQPVLIDPAVYFGHREAEIAFTKLFGGFDREFYRAYDEAWPLQKGWEQRTDLFNIYPLMVHLNLFGRSYLPEIQNILSRYV